MFLLVPAHPGRPRQRAVKWLCVYVCSVEASDILSAEQLSVERTPPEMVKWPASTAEVATLPVQY